MCNKNEIICFDLYNRMVFGTSLNSMVCIRNIHFAKNTFVFNKRKTLMSTSVEGHFFNFFLKYTFYNSSSIKSSLLKKNILYSFLQLHIFY